MRAVLGKFGDRVVAAFLRRAKENSAFDPQHVYPGKHEDYFSASPVAMTRLAERKGYRLVGANRYGFNLIFVKRGLHEERVPQVSLESVLRHPRYFARLDRFEAIKDWKYETAE